MSGAVKEFQSYLTGPTSAHVGNEDYLGAPASASLRYAVEAKSSVDRRLRTFTKKRDGSYRKDSLDSIQHLVAAMLPAEGHFETYERYLFAGMFDLSAYLTKFDVDKFLTRLEKHGGLVIEPRRVAAYRSIGAQSIGLLLTDSLTGRQRPDRVNEYFNAFELSTVVQRSGLPQAGRPRQLRHSIVHTGGTLTLADAQKVPELASLGERKVVFEGLFITEVARKLHSLVKKATDGMGTAFATRCGRTHLQRWVRESRSCSRFTPASGRG